MKLPYAINLLPDGSVIHEDGEYLGTWDTDESDAFFEFTPDGTEQHLFHSPYRWELCQYIQDWHEEPAGKKKPAG